MHESEHIQTIGAIDQDRDPNATGLIGPDDSPIVSTLGQLSAKRTACVPDFAALVTRWLYESGVQSGDKVAVIATSSFPGFNIAAICGVRALGAIPVTQLSLASSEWGMSEPDYTFLDLDADIRQKIPDWPVIDVVTYGAGSDRGHNLPPTGKKLLEKAFARHDRKPVVAKGGLDEQVQARLRLLEEKGPYPAIIFIGGNIAALGVEEMKEIGTGLLPRNTEANNDKLSMMGVYLKRGTPVIYLHWSEALARRWGIEFDPEPLPRPGSVRKIYELE